jgi:uncharacterized protein YggU (UPF0235/DUF167 family)
VPDLRIAVRVRPGASRTKVGGEHGGALVVAVQAPAVGGQATEAALAALAEALGIRRRYVRLVTGATRRDKVVEIDTGSSGFESVAARIAELRGGAR